MKQNEKYFARKNTFMRFLSKSLDENKPEKIKEWIQERLIDKNPEADYETKMGFFEAEREVMRVCLEKGDMDKMQRLFKIFNDFDNEGLKRIQFKMVTDVFKEKKDILTSHPEYHSDLKDILNSAFNKLTNSNDPDFKVRFDDTQVLFTDLLGEASGSSSA